MQERVSRTVLAAGLVLAIISVTALPLWGMSESSAVLEVLSGVAFEKNVGQFDGSVLGRAVVQGTTVWFAEDAVIYQFGRSTDADDVMVEGRSKSAASDLRVFAADRASFEYLTLVMRFEGEPLIPEAIFAEPRREVANYITGTDQSAWVTNTSRYNSFTYGDIYPGIDVVFYERSGKLEWDLRMDSGAEIEDVQLRFDYAEEVEVLSDGSIRIATEWGDMTQSIPEAFQVTRSGSSGIEASFKQYSDGTVGFEASGRDASKATVIDPVVEFSTYLGGTWYDEGWGIATDDKGNMYVCGLTGSTNFPVVQPFQQEPVFPVDIFVSKLSPEGDQLLYSTYIGGSDYEGATSLDVDGEGNVFLTGEVKSTDFPLVNPYQGSYSDNTDAFVLKLDADGQSLVFSTYLGGSDYEYGHTVAASADGEAFVVGQVCSSDFPVFNALQADYGGHIPTDPPHCGDFFLARFSADGGAVYCTYLGGSHYDEGWGIAIDADKNAYFCGLTASADFPTVNSLQPASVLADAVFGKLSADGQTLQFCSYFGGDNYDGATAIAVDDLGNIYFAGETNSADFPTMNAFMETHNSPSIGDAFVTKVAPSGTELVYSTFLGGEYPEVIWDITVDGSGAASVCGHTFSSDFPTINAAQLSFGGYVDGFVTRLAPGGKPATFSSFFGGSDGDVARSLALYNGNNVYLIGSTISTDFPTENALYPTYQGGDILFPRGDAFVTKIAIAHACGDVDGSGSIDISDPIYLLNYIFAVGPAPADDSGGDVDCDGHTTITDAVYMIYYIFSDGDVPCANCP